MIAYVNALSITVLYQAIQIRMLSEQLEKSTDMLERAADCIKDVVRTYGKASED